MKMSQKSNSSPYSTPMAGLPTTTLSCQTSQTNGSDSSITITSVSSIDSNESLNHSQLVAQRISNLFMNERYSDGVLIVEQQRIPVIKSLICQHSQYLDDLFFGSEKTSQVLLPNIRVDPLKAVIKYCHSGEINYNELSIQFIYQVFTTAFELGFNDLASGVTEYLESKINKDSVSEIYSLVYKRKSSPLATSCLNYINLHATALLSSKSFLRLSSEVLADIFSCDEFAAPEIDIFKFVTKWIEQNPGEEVAKVVSKLRLYLISFKDLLNVVRKSPFVNEDVVMGALKARAKKDNMKYRAYWSQDKNVLMPKFKPKLISGESCDGNLFSMEHYFGPDRGYIYHMIGQENKQILVKLGMPAKVNHIKLLLVEHNQNAFSYTVEVSLDQTEWYKIADYSSFWCRSWQNISFHPHVIQYIRIIGIRSMLEPQMLGIVSLQCYLSTNRICFRTNEGIPLIVPGNNVATYANGAAIVRLDQNGRFLINRQSQLLSGDDKLTLNPNCLQLDQSKYTYPACHEITDKPDIDNITIHLSQPYMIDRLRFIIHSPDIHSTYSFVVHVSPDGQNYTLVMDKRTESCTLWQECRFQSMAISFVRVTGTEAYNASDRLFRLVHFECSGSPNK